MSQTGSSNTSIAQHEEPAHSQAPSGQTAACSTSQRRKPRKQTKWPTDVVKVEGIDDEGFPLNDNGLKRWRLICGLIARQRVGINGLFEIMKEYLEFLEGTFEAQMNHVRGAALKSIGKLHKHFKSNLDRGSCLPEEKVCNTVPVKEGYVVVKIDHVHQNVEAIPLPDAEIFTLGDARNTQIQWKKSGILIPPIGRSSSTGGAQKRTRTPTPSPLSPMVQTLHPPSRKIDQATKDQTPEPVTVVASGSPAKKKGRTTPMTAVAKKGRGKAASAKKATKVKGKEAPKEPANTWTLAHPKFVMGKPMLTTEELASAGTGSHYFLVVICPKWEIVWYLDSNRPHNEDDTLGQRDYTTIKAVIDRNKMAAKSYVCSRMQPEAQNDPTGVWYQR
ncbi:hypothetical protein C2845_PM03G26130 [Panicum miliaceum]|uniref:DUF8039 domain-containing protein n=1 Tax=Panicum miliaceum TaxID=4540 RepID=A0A3L6T848_PANMI|nr:hypothetical protein C2845_PM03G26130 [Panicum miliaceum]